MFDFIKNLFRRKDDKILEMARSSGWPKVRKEHLEKEPICRICGGSEGLTVHHVVPFHVAQSRELDQDNLITLCEKNHCHIVFGHLGSYKSYNQHIREDAKIWSKKIKERP